MTKIIIDVKGGLIESIHSNKPIHYVVVDHDLNEINTSVYQEDGSLNDYFDFLDSDVNKEILDNLLSVEEPKIIKPKISLEDAINVLLENGYIRHFWSIEDIKKQAKDDEVELTDDEINDVASKLEDIDCNVGISWETISIMIDEVKG